MKIQQFARVTLTFTSDAKAVADVIQTLQDMGIDQTAIDTQAQKKLSELDPKITKVGLVISPLIYFSLFSPCFPKALDGIDDATIYKETQDLDKLRSGSWTDEDPSYAQIIALIDEEAEKEKD